ncbi:MAG: sigma-70 family RNA polymerase sigma factor [Ruminococcaceae bacterium]|nr:sigma-70 family RNA polymerase sigma factor [Oscillospiraceae bacterium]
MKSYAENIPLIQRAQAGDEAAFSALVEENSGLIWSIARRYFGRGAEPEDLFQLGCVGFIKAVQGFDDTYGTQFSTYAVPKIAGEIRRFLRDDGPVKVSRGTRETSARLLRIKTELERELGREPQLSELSAAAGMTPEEIAVCELAVSPVQSLQQPLGDEGFSLENIIGGEPIEAAIIERTALRSALHALPERERKVLLLRYYRGMTQDKVAKILEVSQVQVSRIERRAIGMLRAQMEG